MWLGTFCWKHARVVILTWLLAALMAGFFASNLTERLLSGAGDIPKSVSLQVDESLRSDSKSHHPREETWLDGVKRFFTSLGSN